MTGCIHSLSDYRLGVQISVGVKVDGHFLQRERHETMSNIDRQPTPSVANAQAIQRLTSSGEVGGVLR